MMWHKTKAGKVIAFFLSAVMLFAGIPFSTFAEGDGTESSWRICSAAKTAPM